MKPIRIRIAANGTALPEEPMQNKEACAKYPRVTWNHIYKPCAVVGGGLSVLSRLEMLRNWKGDIFGINDTAGWLSDHGIPCYVYAIDVTKIPFKIGSLVKGALFASRVNIVQFEQMGERPIWVFDLGEENQKDGIEGGPTAVCRTPHLLAKMGYKGVTYFGIDSSFDPNITHLSGLSQAAYMNMTIVNAGGVNYYTNAGFMLQNQYMFEVLTNPDCKKFFTLESDGLLKAIIENPDTWSVVAIADDLKEKYDKAGCTVWKEKYNGGNEIWRPQAI